MSKHASTKGVNRRVAALDELAIAAREYVGEKPLELLAERDAPGNYHYGKGASPEWTRLIEALAALAHLDAEDGHD